MVLAPPLPFSLLFLDYTTSLLDESLHFDSLFSSKNRKDFFRSDT